jgi:hypothetical protein
MFDLWRLATAIRKDEFMDILKRVAKDDPVLAAALEKDTVWPDIERWFDKTMDRVTQRFTVSTRWVTFAWAITIAFIVHLDASTLFAQLSGNPDIRAKLLASTDVVQSEAERLVNTQNPPPATADLQRTIDEAKQLRVQLSATGLRLMPDDYSRRAADQPALLRRALLRDAAQPRRAVLVQRAEAGGDAAAGRRHDAAGGTHEAGVIATRATALRRCARRAAARAG